MAPRMKHVLGGTIATGQGWSVGFHSEGPASIVPGDMNTLAHDIWDFFNNRVWSASDGPAKALASNLVKLTYCATYAYPTGGSSASVVGRYQPATPISGTGTATAPPQVALVYSLLSDQAGRANRGRVYMPCLNPGSPNANGGFGVGTADQADNMKDFLDDLATHTFETVALIPLVSSRQTALPVSQVRVDDVLDTQRRRRDNIAPTSVSVANLVTT